tara:strand:+ start:145 stop:333 length:189 start_codon:yes stop_codon:yes gene_type:complete
MRRLLLLVIDAYQNQMEANYHEESLLTNLFIEDKFWGWTGLTIIVVCLGIFFWSFYPGDEPK